MKGNEWDEKFHKRGKRAQKKVFSSRKFNVPVIPHGASLTGNFSELKWHSTKVFSCLRAHDERRWLHHPFFPSNFQFALEIRDLFILLCWLFDVNGVSLESSSGSSETWEKWKFKNWWKERVKQKKKKSGKSSQCNFATFSIYVLTWKSIFKCRTWRTAEQDWRKKKSRNTTFDVYSSIVDVRVLNCQTLNSDQTHHLSLSSHSVTTKEKHTRSFQHVPQLQCCNAVIIEEQWKKKA